MLSVAIPAFPSWLPGQVTEVPWIDRWSIGEDTVPMNPQQTACTFLLAAAFCVVGLLLIPVVHVPVMHGPLLIVIHGPTTALRSFRFAAFIRWLLQAAFLIVAAVLPLLHLRRPCRQVVDRAAMPLIVSLPALSPLRC